MNMIWKILVIKSSSKLMIMNFVQVFCEQVLCVLHIIYKVLKRFSFSSLFSNQLNSHFHMKCFYICVTVHGFVDSWYRICLNKLFFVYLKGGKWTWKRKSFCMWWMRIVNDYFLQNGSLCFEFVVTYLMGNDCNILISWLACRKWNCWNLKRKLYEHIKQSIL